MERVIQDVGEVLVGGRGGAHAELVLEKKSPSTRWLRGPIQWLSSSRI